MLYALLNNKKIKPKKGITNAICPISQSVVIPKCGLINVHHWSHKYKNICDDWAIGKMTEWHRFWQNCFHSKNVECIIKQNKKSRFADVFFI